MALPEVKLGIIPGAGGTQRLTHLLGASRAKELIFTGKRLDAEEAAQLGILNVLAKEPQSAWEAALIMSRQILTSGKSSPFLLSRGIPSCPYTTGWADSPQRLWL